MSKRAKALCIVLINAFLALLLHQSLFMILRSLLYIVAAILVLGWLLGFVYFKTAGNLIHILLVLAVISIIIGLFSKKEID